MSAHCCRPEEKYVKVLMLLMLTMMLCSSCTALPAEERAFAVALCVEKDEVWRVHGRIPTYQSGGGYLTITGEGSNIDAALSALDAASPMRINLSQLRLVAADVKLAESVELPAFLSALSERPDMRMQCALALTDAPAEAVAEALKPAAGTRLSKALDLMLDARIEQGVILPASLSDVLRGGERQSPILIALSLEGQEISLSGGYTLGGEPIQPEETALLSLLLGHGKSLRLELPEGSAEVRDVSVSICLSEDMTTARVALKMTATASAFTAEGLESSLANALLVMLMRFSAGGCDALGLGRQAIMRTHDMVQSHALNWPERYRAIRWEVAVSVRGAA